MTDVTDRLAGLSPEKRRLLESRLKLARQATAELGDGVRPRPRPDGTAPLSFAQQRQWVLERMEPGTATWNIPLALRIRGALDVAALERALDALRERHESLRTTFAEREGQAVQVIHPFAPVPLPVEDLSHLDPAAREAEASQRAQADMDTGFDLEAGPLFRARLLRLAPDEHALLLCMHHIVSDGWSSGVIERELAALYAAFAAGQPNPLPPPALQYADFAAWQRERLAGAGEQAMLDFWRRTLAGAPPALELPTDRPRPRTLSHRGARVAAEMPPAAADRLRALARGENATLFAVLLAAYRIVLSRWTGEDDVVVGTPVAGRTRVETEGLVGYFVNTLALRTPTAGDPAFRELLRRERDTALDAFANQELPFERIVDELKVPRDPARTPVFQVLFSLQNSGGGNPRLPGVELEPLETELHVSKFDLAVEVFEHDEGLTLVADYPVDLFDEETADRLLGHVVRVLEQVLAAPDVRLSQISLLTADERETALFGHNRTQREWPFAPVQALVRAQAAATPDAPAVDGPGGALTYAELEARAEAVAAALRARGVGRGDLVAVLLERSADLPAALLGALKAGAAYLPLDPTYPAERVRWMLEDSRAAAVVTHPHLHELLGDAGPARILVDALEAAGDPSPAVEVDGDDLAYVIYTSGSTGLPKGAAIPHRALDNHVRWMQEDWPLAPGDRVLQKTPVSFDASVWEFWAPLVAGATLVMAGPEAHRDPPALAAEVAERGITILQLVPTLLRAVLEEPAFARATSLRRLFAGGEALPSALARRAAELLPSVEVVNLYGPTETCIDATAYRFDPADAAEVVPLGGPIANLRAWVLDARLQPVPPGVPGELWLAGEGLGRGYPGRPSLTAGRWIPEPFGGTPGARMYRTGDRARWREVRECVSAEVRQSGDADASAQEPRTDALTHSRTAVLEYLGRADEQVKIRGARVEPGEIESALRALPNVADCAVVARADAAGALRLAAYVVPRGAFDPSAVRAELSGRLPTQFVPSAIVAIDSLPRTATGKVDRRALPSPDFGAARTPRGEAPSTPDEELLAAIWAEVLGVATSAADAPRDERTDALTHSRTTGIHAGDDFFERGGHSLLATQVVSRVRAVFGVELPLRAMFEAPVLRDQARRIAALRAADEGEPAGPIPRADRSAPLPLSFAQERLWFIDQLEPGSAAYNVPTALELRGALDAAALERALGEVVRRHEPLRTVFREQGTGDRGQPDGPVQVVAPFAGFHLPVTDLTAFSGDERRAEADRILEDEARRPFDLAAGPVVRARLLKLGDGDHVLSLVLHHVATDAWSSGVLFRELAALYDAYRQGEDSPLADLPVQYADFAAWQRGWLRGEALERQTGYWRRKLAGAPAVLEIPTDRPRPAVQDTAGGLLPFELPADAVAAAHALARREGATTFMVLLAAFDALLHRLTGEEDVVVGTPIANRTRPELEGLVGFFDNTLALRTDVGGDPSFRTLLRRVREATLEAYAHQDVPFEKLVDELKIERSLSHTPLFQVMLTLQNAPTAAAAPALGELQIMPLAVETGTSRFDLTLILSEAGDEIGGWAEYATALFDQATVERLTRHLGTLLGQAAANPDAPLSALSFLSEAEREQVVRAFNATDRPRAPETVHALVAAQAARTPDAVAIEHRGERVTYAELEARANRLAHRLRRLGVGPDARVAVSMERSVDMVVSTIAILKAGGGYVAIDPNYPADRVGYMLADSRAAVVITTTDVAARLAATDAAVLCLDAERDAIAAEPSDDPGVPVDPDNLLYVLYTSGSTGKPKGAALPHRALANVVRWQIERWGDGDQGDDAATDLVGARHASPVAAATPMSGDGDVPAAATTGGGADDVSARATDPAAAATSMSGDGDVPAAATTGGGADDVSARATDPAAAATPMSGDGDVPGDARVAARTLQFASLSFDVSFQEIYPTWASGGTLVLIDDDTRRDAEALIAHLREHRIERLFLPFAALQNLAETAEFGDAHLPDLREVITAGEALRSTPQLRAFFRANPQASLDNHYGPSETHVISAHLVAADPEAWPGLPPIGAPVANTRLYVLDARMQPVPAGVPGELYAGGANLARGYLGRPALTAQKFVPDPFGPAGSRLYRTGDRVRWKEERASVRECVSASDSREDGRTHALTHSRTAVLEYLGRTDFQVKIRGFRVEPGEIEAALTEHPSVVQAAVVVRGEGAGKRLAAYVVPAAGAAPAIADLRAHLAVRLPEYMVPSAWRVMPALPLTPSGKVDRRSLPEPDTGPATAHVPPRSPAERMVADAWEAVLGVRPGAHDNFFDLGGHSLRATQVVSRIRRAFGVDLPLRALFEDPTVAGLAERAVAARRGEDVRFPPLVPTARGRTSPLSFAQQRYWFVERMGAAGAAYNMPNLLRLHGDLDVEAMERALNGLLARHEALRTTFRFREDAPVQDVAPELFIPLRVTDLSALPEGERQAEAQRLSDAEGRTPFDLAAGPLIRWQALRLAADEHVLLLNMHHIISDGWSLGVLFRELGVLYRAAREGVPDPLPPLPIQYPDYAHWQRERMSGEALDRELEWWRQRLEGAATLALPTDRPHPPLQSFRGAGLFFELPPELVARVEATARAEGATPFMVLLTAFTTLLSRWSGTDDVVVGSPVAGRVPEETEGLIGTFANTLALRTDLSGDPSFRDALHRVRENVVDAYAHQDLPFERLVEELKVERSLSVHPLFQVVFSMHAQGAGAPDLPGLRVEMSEGGTGTAKVDLMLALAHGGGRMGGVFEYASDLFDEETIARFSAHFETLLSAAVAAPERRISALPLMRAEERGTVVAWGQGPPALTGPALVHRLVEQEAARAPDLPALVDGGVTLSYREFDRLANRLAHRLVRAGVRPESRVAVCFDRSIELVLGQYAAMKAGGAYVPIDPAYPPERIAHLLRDSAAPVLLTTSDVAASLPEWAGAVIPLDREWDDGDEGDDAPPAVELDPANAVYVIYTSGSTGTPKGVVLPHASLANLIAWRNGEYGVGPRDRTPLITGVGFDAAASETWPALAAGASLHVVPPAVRTDPPALRDWMAREGMTVCFIATPLAEALLPLDWPEGTRLRFILTGGDALHARPRPETPFILANGYGPTENAIISTSCNVEPDGEGQPDIGRPLHGTQAYVLDRRMEAAPVGIAGELYLGGANLARGYLDRPALTAEKFLPDPFSTTPGARLYRTGDRVRWRRDGRIDFLGRADLQVKVRGHRIEPGEIETVLMRHPDVRQAVVDVRGQGAGRRLVAWIVGMNGGAPAAELRAWLRTRIPEYLVPAAFVVVDALPLTANGKVDRTKLPEPAPERPAESAPKSAAERAVARVWEEVLGVPVGVDDNFFEIGGHSLLMARVQERMREAMGVEVSVIDLFQYSTVRQLAEQLEARRAAGDAAPQEDTAAAQTGQDRAAMRREMMRRGRR